MPLVRIDVQEGRTPAQLRRIADVIQEVMLDVFAAPPRDREVEAARASARAEKRFGAVLTVLTPSTAEFAVGSPPTTARDAELLTGEFAAFAPDEPEQDGAARVWAFGWPD